MSITAFVKEQAPKLSNFQLEAIRERFAVREAATLRMQQAAERSFPHVTLNDAILEAIESASVPKREEPSRSVQPSETERSAPLTAEENSADMADSARARLVQLYEASTSSAYNQSVKSEKEAA